MPGWLKKLRAYGWLLLLLALMSVGVTSAVTAWPMIYGTIILTVVVGLQTGFR